MTSPIRLADAHRRIIDLTLSTLRPDAHQVRQWQEMLRACRAYTATRLNRRLSSPRSTGTSSLLSPSIPPTALPALRSVVEQRPPDNRRVCRRSTARAPSAADRSHDDGEELTFLLDDAEPESPEPARRAASAMELDYWRRADYRHVVAVAIIRSRQSSQARDEDRLAQA